MKYRLLALVFVVVVLASFSLQSDGQNKEPDEVITPIRFGPQVMAAPTGLTPAQVRRAYGFDVLTNRGDGQTIAVIDAFDQPYIEEDLAVFSQTFNLPPCTTANGCFRKITTTKNDTKPPIRQIWALEISLDVEWAHAIAPDARILLVETKSAKLADLMEGVELAVDNGATVVSMSWGAPEFEGQLAYDLRFRFLPSTVTLLASSGDFGTGVFYPAASPYVIGVGGTTLNVDAQGNYISETALSASGGGLSAFEDEPSYQMQFGLPNNPDHQRGVPDVAYNADFATAFAVYSSFPYLGFKGWIPVGGTSAGAPQWAGLFAIVNSMRSQAGKSPLTAATAALYGAASAQGPAKFNDITSGSNGTCGPLCTAAPSFDYVTGLGSPRAYRLVPALVAAP